MCEFHSTLPFCFRPTPHDSEPTEAQPPPLTPQRQMVRPPTVEEVAIPRSRVKTTGDVPRAWVFPSNSSPKPLVPATSSPSVLLSNQQQTPPLVETLISKTPHQLNWVTSPPTTPPRRYTPKVTDFALPRHRRYRLSIQWKPRPWDVDDLKARGSPLQPTFSGRSRDNAWSSPCPRQASVPPQRKLRYSLEGLAEHPQRPIRRRYTDGIVGSTRPKGLGRSCE